MECSVCNVSFGALNNLRKHIKCKHPEEDVDKIAPTLTSQKVFNFECETCNHHFTTEVALNSHVRKHDGDRDNCQTVLHSNFQEFSVWKADLEKETKSFFKKTHVQTLGGKVTHYYKCHSSGKFVSQGSGIRRLKRSGSCKINGLCPAKMKVVVTNNQVTTTFYPNHEGHGKEPQHLRLTKEEKMTLAKDLADGIPFNRILDKVRSTLESIDSDRMHLLAAKDLHNIVQQFKLEEHVRHSDDSTSVESFPASISSPEENDLGKEACRKELLALIDSAGTAVEMAIIRKGIHQIRATLTAVHNQNQLPAAKSNGKRNISPQQHLHSTKKKRLAI